MNEAEKARLAFDFVKFFLDKGGVRDLMNADDDDYKKGAFSLFKECYREISETVDVEDAMGTFRNMADES